MDRDEQERLEARLKERLAAHDGAKYHSGTDLPRAGVYHGEAGQLTGATQAVCADDGTYVRHLLESRRDQLRREANAVQSLLDVLPTKIPHQAAQAIQGLLSK